MAHRGWLLMLDVVQINSGCNFNKYLNYIDCFASFNKAFKINFLPSSLVPTIQRSDLSDCLASNVELCAIGAYL